MKRLELGCLDIQAKSDTVTIYDNCEGVSHDLDVADAIKLVHLLTCFIKQHENPFNKNNGQSKPAI